MTKRLAVFVSGQGSILEAILKSGVVVDLVIADRECPAVELMKENSALVIVVDRKKYIDSHGVLDRLQFTAAITAELKQFEIDFIAMAGFMTILSDEIFGLYPNRIINTHPSLLPAFKGDKAVQSALDYGVMVSGMTIHYVVPEVDSGEIIHQKSVPIFMDDDLFRLSERIKIEERKIYPVVIRNLMSRL